MSDVATASHAGDPVRRAPELPTISSDQLFGNEVLICIEHRGQRYYLRRTREDKLLLTK